MSASFFALLVDSVYELPLSLEVDVASSSDMTHLTPLVEDLKKHHKKIHKDIDETAADKGYDSAENNAELFAAAFGFECQGRTNCEKLPPVGVGDFGRVVRVPLELDRRVFTPIARHTDKWEKSYDRRTSVERVNSRLDQVLGFEHHTIRGKAKMEMRVTLALVVMLAMALGRIRIGQREKMRSLVAPIQRAA